ncbi:hypothetical protein LCGC14_2154620 [marine sediment metagenome]|uniref:HTH marR-type domain-containing protein n=1 Tax=marine sediment metagenome TaxID=412755 RepID=A0A0F9EGS6_9ZZZZ
MNQVLDHVMASHGISVGDICTHLNLTQSNVSSQLTGLKHRKLVDNGYGKWYCATSVIELDDNMIEITHHNGDVEIWES